jgi:hypothetical protein
LQAEVFRESLEAGEFKNVIFGINLGAISMKLVELEKAANFFLPIISGLGLSSDLNDPVAVPMFTRLAMTNEQLSLIISRVIER